MCRMSLARELYPYITEKVDVVHSDMNISSLAISGIQSLEEGSGDLFFY